MALLVRATKHFREKQYQLKTNFPESLNLFWFIPRGQHSPKTKTRQTNTLQGNCSTTPPISMDAGTSLVIQWPRIHLPVPGTEVSTLAGEPRSHLPWGNWPPGPQLLSPRPTTTEPTCSEPTPQLERSPYITTKTHVQQQRSPQNLNT